jgi:hypothetical protein
MNFEDMVADYEREKLSFEPEWFEVGPEDDVVDDDAYETDMEARSWFRALGRSSR